MDTSELSSLYMTIIFVGLITLAFYFLIISPFLPARRVAAAPNPTAPVPSNRNNKTAATRVPCHVADQSKKIAADGGSNLLSDGLVAFRHSKASLYEQEAQDKNQLIVNRKDRAKILSRLIEDGTISSPPAKGSTLVVSIPASQVNCKKLRRVLFLFGTYYNLLVILSVPSSSVDRIKLIEQLRGSDEDCIPSQVLPDHRIILASTAAGRITLVRQIQKVELVLDFELEVQTQLSRFGHQVIAYGSSSPSGRLSAPLDLSSALGNQLLS